MVTVTFLLLVKCKQRHISCIWYQTYLVKFQQPCINVTGCKSPQAVRFTFNYVGVGLCLKLVLLAAGFLKSMRLVFDWDKFSDEIQMKHTVFSAAAAT